MLLKYARRVVIFVIGTTVVLLGIAMLVLPGPGLVVIPVGLAILATEYAWARRWLRFMRDSAEKGVEKLNLRSVFPFLSRFSFFSQKRDPGERDAESNQ